MAVSARGAAAGSEKAVQALTIMEKVWGVTSLEPPICLWEACVKSGLIHRTLLAHARIGILFNLGTPVVSINGRLHITFCSGSQTKAPA